jgi:hypothetical protein
MPFKNGNPPLYTIWRSMLSRCYNPKDRQYRDYGGRGITVCEEWRYNYKRFYADMAPRPSGLSIDRKDNNGNYSKENCKWSTRKEQQRNQRVTIKVIIEGNEYIAADLADLAGIKTDSIVDRVRRGLPYAEVVKQGRQFNLKPLQLGAAVSSIRRKARTHCRNGHLWTPETSGVRKEGKYTWRYCKQCRRKPVNEGG